MGDGKIMAPARDGGQRARLTAERWQQIKAVLSAALEKDTAERAIYLDQACAADTSLRAEVESLLAVEDQSSPDFLASSWSDPMPDSSNCRIGRRVGPYQLIEEIGTGGMGEVYRAFRADDQYKKEVAIKLVRSGFNSEFVVARFRNERQVVANLEHPNIGRLLDGGTTDDGIPYFVMELIRGEPFIQYCDEHRLPTTDRLKLFLQVCSAVQYAHQRLIVHRDLKPGNVLVTVDGTAKLLDFGIAKILDPSSSVQSIDATVPMLRLLTPAYASPEQVKGEAITTATDVYSLGVILYECLSGHSPYGASARSPHTISQAICEVEPGKPSTVIRRTEKGTFDHPQTEITPVSVSMTRSSTPEKLSRRLRGDLDNIVLMALRKEPQRRYTSVEQLAEDIRRHLNNLPVIARRDTVAYRASKFLARHKAAVGTAAMVVLALVLGITVTVREERLAKRRFNDVRSLANSLIFDVHDSIKDLPGSTPARKMIVERALQYLNALAGESHGELGLQRELATAYERVGLVQGHYLQDNLGDAAGSLSSYQKALALRSQVAAKSADWNDRLALAEAYRLVADLLWTVGNPEARKNIDAAIRISEALNSSHPNQLKILYELGFDYSVSHQIGYRGDANEKSERLQDLKKGLGISEAALRIKPDDVSFLHASAVDLLTLGTAIEESDPSAALGYAQQAAIIEHNLTLQSNASKYMRQLAIAYLQIASAYDDLGNYARAADNDQKYLAMYVKLNTSDPKNVLLRQGLAIAYANTGSEMAKIGKLQAAVQEWGKAVAIMRDLVSRAPENLRQRHKLAEIIAVGGAILMRAHQPDAAIRYVREARGIYQSIGPNDDLANIANCSAKMGEAAAAAGDSKSAKSYFHEALSAIESLPPGQDSNVTALYTAADAYSGLGDLSFRNAMSHSREKAELAEARSWYLKSTEAWRRIPHPSHSGPNGIEVGDPKLVTSKLQQCEAALNGLPRP